MGVQNAKLFDDVWHDAFHFLSVQNVKLFEFALLFKPSINNNGSPLPPHWVCGQLSGLPNA